MYTRIAAILSIFLISLSNCLAADAEHLLARMQQAMRKLNYQGTLALLRDGKLDTLNYLHAVVNGEELERMTSLNSPKHEVVRNEGKVSCFSEGSGQVLIDHRPTANSFLIEMSSDLDKILQNYDLRLIGEAKVAQLQASLVVLKPRDRYRYGHRMWLDNQHALPLKAEVFDQQGNTIEQFIFTDLQLLESIPSLEQTPARANFKVRHIHETIASNTETAGFSLSQVPAGFERQFILHMSNGGHGHKVEHLLLTDGLASVSVYLEDENDSMPEGAQNAGSVNSYVRKLDGFTVTVMGEVPADNVKYIAEGITLRQAGL